MQDVINKIKRGGIEVQEAQVNDKVTYLYKYSGGQVFLKCSGDPIKYEVLISREGKGAIDYETNDITEVIGSLRGRGL